MIWKSQTNVLNSRLKKAHRPWEGAYTCCDAIHKRGHNINGSVRQDFGFNQCCPFNLNWNKNWNNCIQKNRNWKDFENLNCIILKRLIQNLLKLEYNWFENLSCNDQASCRPDGDSHYNISHTGSETSQSQLNKKVTKSQEQQQHSNALAYWIAWTPNKHLDDTALDLLTYRACFTGIKWRGTLCLRNAYTGTPKKNDRIVGNARLKLKYTLYEVLSWDCYDEWIQHVSVKC